MQTTATTTTTTTKNTKKSSKRKQNKMSRHLKIDSMKFHIGEIMSCSKPEKQFSGMISEELGSHYNVILSCI